MVPSRTTPASRTKPGTWPDKSSPRWTTVGRWWSTALGAAPCSRSTESSGEHRSPRSARVVDVHEWLAPRLARLPITHSGERVAIQDPCHLRHAQRTHESVRTVLEPVADVVELDDEGLCCARAGPTAQCNPSWRAPSATGSWRPSNAREPNWWPAPTRAALHLAAAGLTVAHPLELVDRALSGAGRGG